jgi:hypothetical protein
VLGVDADDDTCTAIDLAVNPDLPIVIDVRFEPHSGARHLDAI